MKTHLFIFLIRDECRVSKEKRRGNENDYVFRSCLYSFKAFIQKFHFLQESDILKIIFHNHQVHTKNQLIKGR